MLKSLMRKSFALSSWLRGPVLQRLLSILVSVVVHVNKTQVRMVLPELLHRTAGLPESVVLAKCNTGRGWASVLNTQWSKGKRSSPENSRYKYLKIIREKWASVRIHKKIKWAQLWIQTKAITYFEQLDEKHITEINLSHSNDLKTWKQGVLDYSTRKSSKVHAQTTWNKIFYTETICKEHKTTMLAKNQSLHNFSKTLF